MGRDVRIIIGVAGLRGFNPRARMGRDADYNAALEAAVMFQSTRPHGARHHAQRRQRGSIPVSIHAPAWGATRSNADYPGVPIQFQSTRPHGARLFKYNQL